MPLKLTQDLRARLAGAERHLADLGKARHALVLPAATGDARSRKALDDNAGQISLAERDISDLKAAITQADEQFREERLSDAKRAAEGKLADAKKIAAEILQADERIDRALVEMTAMLRKRLELRNDLVRTGAFREAYIARLSQSGPLERAIDHAGLAEFIGTPRRNAMRQTLHSQDERLLSTLRLPALTLEANKIDPVPTAPDDSDQEEHQAADNAA
jgi:hypothetical protein